MACLVSVALAPGKLERYTIAPGRVRLGLHAFPEVCVHLNATHGKLTLLARQWPHELGVVEEQCRVELSRTVFRIVYN